MKKSDLPEFQWTLACQEGFDQLKKAFMEVPIYVSQLRAGGPVIPSLTSSGQGRTQSEHVPSCYGSPVYYGDEHYSSLWAGTHEPH